MARRCGWGCEAKNRFTGPRSPRQLSCAGWGRWEAGCCRRCSPLGTSTWTCPLEGPLPRSGQARGRLWAEPTCGQLGTARRLLERGRNAELWQGTAGPASCRDRLGWHLEPTAGVSSQLRHPAAGWPQATRMSRSLSHALELRPHSAAQGHMRDGGAQASVRHGARTCKRSYCSPKARPRASRSPARPRLPACKVGTIGADGRAGRLAHSERSPAGGTGGRHCWLAALCSRATPGSVALS